MSDPRRIVLEKCPYEGHEARYAWTAYQDGREDDLSRTGHTPEEALARFLNALKDQEEMDL